jgi:hypothetical protein
MGLCAAVFTLNKVAAALCFRGQMNGRPHSPDHEIQLKRWLMFCSNCRRPIHYKNLENEGWCEHCHRVIEVSTSSISYWCIAAVIMMPWLV